MRRRRNFRRGRGRRSYHIRKAKYHMRKARIRIGYRM
jgi:hypothetical protein